MKLWGMDCVTTTIMDHYVIMIMATAANLFQNWVPLNAVSVDVLQKLIMTFGLIMKLGENKLAPEAPD